MKKTHNDAHARVTRCKWRCALEDSGGIDGYQNLIDTLANLDTVEETGREHAQWLQEWAQGTAQRSGEETFDPGYFDLAAINTSLEKLFTPDPGEARLGNL